MRLDLPRAVLLTTVVSVVASVLITALLNLAQSSPMVQRNTMVAAIAVPLIVAPIIGHIAWSLFFEVERSRALLLQASMRDDMTQLFNRRHFMERLETATAQSLRSGRALSVLMIDADDFKAINDSHGHAVGDTVIRQLAAALVGGLRPGDVVARYGGEEFIALLPDTTLEDASHAAERLRARVEEGLAPMLQDGPERITVSIGLSSFVGADDSTAELLIRADRALYQAKAAGRNRVVGLPHA